MDNENDKYVVKRNDKMLSERLHKLEQELQEKKEEHEQVETELKQVKQEFNSVKRSKFWRYFNPAKIMQSIRSVGAFSLGRRNLKQIYSKTYKRKKAANDLKKYKFHLYNLGFTDKALQDLECLLQESTNPYLRRAITWELALWYANHYTADGAEHALRYLHLAEEGEEDIDQMRRIAILKAECYDLLGDHETGKKIIHAMLRMQRHHDLLLALVNLETTPEDRLNQFNHVMEMYELAPIALQNDGKAYDDLMTLSNQENSVDGPKVSVILPAYNAELGIRTAIQSMLSQTWSNIELLIVDDCSTDNTFQVAKEYEARDARVKVFTTSENSGPYVARNIALKEASGEFVTINDADDWSHAEKIERQVKHLLENEAIIANTSAHSRITEDLRVYRRGTPGKYIFPNMSSLLFRREIVIEKLGCWDSVRFAADGEFKRRLIECFGSQSIVDLDSGPLSLPRQSVTSLTGSSAFGYNGFFMGARKEYVESFTFYHKKESTLHYSSPLRHRLYPVPEPMWPIREEKVSGYRLYDVVIAADFYKEDESYEEILYMIDINNQIGVRTGLVQMATYGTHHRQKMSHTIRKAINDEKAHMLVYGEKIKCAIIILYHPTILQYKQKYIPEINTPMASVIIPKIPLPSKNLLRDSSRNLMDYFGVRGKWFANNEQVKQQLISQQKKDLRFIKLSQEPWLTNNKFNEDKYKERLNHWLIHR